MPQEFLDGLIFLFSKCEGVSENINKWRPIIVLNTIYKIFTKVIANQFQLILHMFIHDT
jgi:hypothetical protein